MGVVVEPESCVHCRKRPAVSRDHVPPKGLFQRPRPDNLIRVPACEDCDNGRTKDDEYLQHIYSFDYRADTNLSASNRRNSILAKFKDGIRTAALAALLRKGRPTSFYTPSGLYVGDGLEIDVDGRRLTRVHKCVVTGLFYVEYGRPLANDYGVVVLHADVIEANASVEAQRKFGEGFVKRLQAVAPRIFGRDEFEYRCVAAIDNENCTAWWLTYYGRIHVFAGTLRNDVIEKNFPGA